MLWLCKMISLSQSFTSHHFGQQYHTFILIIGKLTAPVKLAFSSPPRGLTENSHILLTPVGGLH